MTLAALTTFTALLLAHVLADFIFQTKTMVTRKAEPAFLLGHIAIVGALTFLVLGGSPLLALGIAITHLAIDAIKIYLLPKTLTSFILDQAAHIAVLGAATFFYMTQAISNTIWLDHATAYLPLAILITGGIISIVVAGYLIQHLMERFGDLDLPPGLPGAGTTIGMLERSIIFTMVLIGEPTGIGFLIAAKSILRFDTAKNQKVGEYVIIGTLASFAWAIAMSYLTVQALALAHGLIAT